MTRRRLRLIALWTVAAMLLVGSVALMAVFDQRERLRSKIAVARAHTAYRDGKLARELAEADVVNCQSALSLEAWQTRPGVVIYFKGV